MKATLCAAIFAAFTAGCGSTSPYAAVSAIPIGSRVNPVIELPGLEPADVAVESAGTGAATGAVGGAAGGAMAGLGASLECGMFFWICAPALMVAGAVGGTVAGTVYGAEAGADLTLPEEKAMAVESIMDSPVAETNIAALFEEEFRRHNAGRWQLDDKGSAATLTIGIDALYLQQSKGDGLAVELQSYARIRYGPSESEQTKKIIFRSTSD